MYQWGCHVGAAPVAVPGNRLVGGSIRIRREVSHGAGPDGKNWLGSIATGNENQSMSDDRRGSGILRAWLKMVGVEKDEIKSRATRQTGLPVDSSNAAR